MKRARAFGITWTLKIAYKIIFMSTAVRIRSLVEIMQACRRGGHLRLAKFCSRLLERNGVYISCKSVIGDNLRLPHPTAIVIGEGVRIGDNVTIFQSVTLGGRIMGDGGSENYPEVSDGCVLFAGAVIVGKVHIGKNSVIGANSVVISNVPDNVTAVGAPAYVIEIKTSSEGTHS